MAKARKDDGAAYFGPFKNRRSVQIAIDLVNNHYPLRTCPRTFKNARSYGSPCIQLDLGKCLGPCVGRADRDEYMRHVREVVAFLGGENEVMLDRLHAQLEVSAQSLDYERARKLRNSIQLLQRLIGAHVQLKEADELEALLVVQPGAVTESRTVMLVVRGRVWSTTTVNKVTNADELAGRLSASWQRYRLMGLTDVDHQSLDDVIILTRWISRAGSSPCVIRLASVAEIDWLAASEIVLGLTEEMLVPMANDELLEDIVEPAEPSEQIEVNVNPLENVDFVPASELLATLD
jgi:DNA polymerase III subunit epsilon